jgi:hypothetical protein
MADHIIYKLIRAFVGGVVGQDETSTKAFFIMNSFVLSFRDYFKALTVPNTTPRVVYVNGKFTCMWYFSKRKIEQHGGEVIYG